MTVLDVDFIHGAAGLGELLKRHRLALGLTQEALAESADTELLAGLEDTNICATKDPLDASMTSADERRAALEVKVR